MKLKNLGYASLFLALGACEKTVQGPLQLIEDLDTVFVDRVVYDTVLQREPVSGFLSYIPPVPLNERLTWIGCNSDGTVCEDSVPRVDGRPQITAGRLYGLLAEWVGVTWIQTEFIWASANPFPPNCIYQQRDGDCALWVVVGLFNVPPKPEEPLSVGYRIRLAEAARWRARVLWHEWTPANPHVARDTFFEFDVVLPPSGSLSPIRSQILVDAPQNAKVMVLQ